MIASTRSRPFAPIGMLLAIVGLFGLETAPALAADVTIPVVRFVNKTAKVTKFVSKGSFTLPNPATDNPVSVGAFLTFTEGAITETISLPAGHWTALGKPAGSAGFKYKDATGATCKVVLIKGKVIKGICKASAPAAPVYNPASDPPLSILLSIGSGGQRYCAECPNGAVQRGNPTKLTKLKGCAAPASCPAPPPASFLDLTTIDPATYSGACGGSITVSSGSGAPQRLAGNPSTTLSCGGLNIGGGYSTPFLEPERLLPVGTTSRYALTGCSGNTCTIGPHAIASSGNYECSDTGCYFGTPMPRPGILSFCLVNTLSAPVSGTVDISNGALLLNVPLNAHLYATQNSTQPCPICRVGAGGTGLPCNTGTPGAPCSGFCDSGTAGAACKSTSADGYSTDCVPRAGKCFLGTNPDADCVDNAGCMGGGSCVVDSATISMNLSQLRNDAPVSMTDSIGNFCPGQVSDSGNGCFYSDVSCPGGGTCMSAPPGTCSGGDRNGLPCAGVCTAILETGSTEGASLLPVGTQRNTALAATFCIPSTGGVLDDLVTLPGPGAVSFAGRVELVP